MPQTPMPQVHPIPPLFDAESRVLILGSFPSIKSREAMFFYGHPQNRFWPLLALLTGEPAPQTVEEKRALALRHHFALWDSIGQCTITGSSDSSILRRCAERPARHHGACADRTHFLQREHVAEILPPL